MTLVVSMMSFFFYLFIYLIIVCVLIKQTVIIILFILIQTGYYLGIVIIYSSYDWTGYSLKLIRSMKGIIIIFSIIK